MAKRTYEEILEFVIGWTNNIPEAEELTRELRETTARLAYNLLPSADDYALEKFVKTFFEPLPQLHKLLQMQEGVDHRTLMKEVGRNPHALNHIAETRKRIDEQIRVCARRQARHFTIFWPFSNERTSV